MNRQTLIIVDDAYSINTRIFSELVEYDKKCFETLDGHTDSVNSVSVTPDGKRAVSGGGYNDKTLRGRDLEMNCRKRRKTRITIQCA